MGHLEKSTSCRRKMTRMFMPWNRLRKTWCWERDRPRIREVSKSRKYAIYWRNLWYSWANDPGENQPSLHCETPLCVLNAWKTILCHWLPQRWRALLPLAKRDEVLGVSSSLLCGWDHPCSRMLTWEWHHLQGLEARECHPWLRWSHQTDWFRSKQASSHRRQNDLHFLRNSRISRARNSARNRP